MRSRRTLSLVRHRGPQRQVFVVGVILCLFAALLFSLVLPMAAQSSTDGSAKMVSLMQANNYNFITTARPLSGSFTSPEPTSRTSKLFWPWMNPTTRWSSLLP